MTGFLFTSAGLRKYLVTSERKAFVAAALKRDIRLSTFCITLAISGARISEVLALTSANIDIENEAIIFRTLKQRKRDVYRVVPVPPRLLRRLRQINHDGARLWPWGRTTAWKIVKEVMVEAGIAGAIQVPKALRHGFAVDAIINGVPLNLVQRWLGHARIETTAIYTNALGDEEKALARRTWTIFPHRSTLA